MGLEGVYLGLYLRQRGYKGASYGLDGAYLGLYLRQRQLRLQRGEPSLIGVFRRRHVFEVLLHCHLVVATLEGEREPGGERGRGRERQGERGRER